MSFCIPKYHQSCAVENIYVLTNRGTMEVRVAKYNYLLPLETVLCLQSVWVSGISKDGVVL